MKRFSIFVLVLAFFALVHTSAQAISDPPLFSCTGPIGQTTASYSDGTHGVPGDSSTYTGQDQVFQVDSQHVLQCLCPTNSINGVQSNWWQVSDVSQTDIDFFVRRGWVWVPNGQAWGLNDAPYLVKNDGFSCGNKGSNTGDGGSNNGSTSTSGSSSSTPSPNDPGDPGKILGISTLADTGSQKTILAYAGVGALACAIAIRLSRKRAE